jgi:hypothetical protein
MKALRVLWWAFLIVGAALLAVRYGGFADGWIEDNLTCSEGSNMRDRPCEEGEAMGAVGIVGWSFLAVGVFMAILMPRLERDPDPLPPDQAEGRAPAEPRALATLDLSRFTRRKR